MHKASIQIVNNVKELNRVASFIETLAKEWNLPQQLAMHINLALEEVLSNIIFYAFDDENEHTIIVAISHMTNKLKLIITDDGKHFDPGKQNLPELNASIEERVPGGLGIFLVQQLMDSLVYERKENQNILTLEKSFQL